MVYAKNKFRLYSFGFIKNRNGATALEFAIVAPVLFAFIFGIIELGAIFFGYNDLYNATQTAARLVRTGQAQQSGMSQQQLIAQACAKTVILTNCANKLQLGVISFPSFAGIAAPATIDGSGNAVTSLPYLPGGPSQITLVTGVYEWSLLGISITAPFSNLADGNCLLQSSVIVQNEPFP